jgi:hypothetical protein
VNHEVNSRQSWLVPVRAKLPARHLLPKTPKALTIAICSTFSREDIHLIAFRTRPTFNLPTATGTQSHWTKGIAGTVGTSYQGNRLSEGADFDFVVVLVSKQRLTIRCSPTNSRPSYAGIQPRVQTRGGESEPFRENSCHVLAPGSLGISTIHKPPLTTESWHKVP